MNKPASELIALADLRSANKVRQAEWDPDNQLTLAYRGNELAGEVGEACNVIKKLERERLGITGSRDTVAHLAEELADVVICADLIAMDLGINLLNEAVPAKFNATSERVGLKTRLAANQSGSERAGVDALRNETGWLIEKDDPLVYHLVTSDHDEHWTTDASKALRFARREDAQAYSDHIGWTSPPVRIVEHMWSDGKRVTPPAQPAPASGESSSSSDGGVEGHAIPQTTSATTTRYPETEGERNMVAPARRTEVKAPTKTGQAGIKPGPSEAPSTHGKPDRAVRSALINVQKIIAEAALTGFNWKDGDWADRLYASQQVTSAALHSPKGDVLAMKEACKRILSERVSIGERAMKNPKMTEAQLDIWAEVINENRDNLAAIDRIDVKADAKSQEPDAVAAWRVRTPEGYCTRWFDGPPPKCYGPYELAYAHPTTKPEAPAVSVDAIKAALRPFIGHDTLGVKAQDAARVVAALIAGGR